MLDEVPAPPVEREPDGEANEPLTARPRGVGAASTTITGRPPQEHFSSRAKAPSLADDLPDERLLAWLRLSATAILLLSIAFDPQEHHQPSEHSLIVAYLCYAAAILVASVRARGDLHRHANAIHTADFAWTAAASSISGGAASHAFPFFAFVLAASAYRWGLARTLIDCGLILTVATIQIAAAATGLSDSLFQFDLYVVHVAAMVVGMAILFGVIADRLHLSRRHAVSLAGLVSDLSRAPRLSRAIVDTIVTLARETRARGALLVVEEAYAGKLSLWRLETAADEGYTVSRTDLPPDTSRDWFIAGTDSLAPSEFRRETPEAEPQIVASLAPAPADASPWLPLPRGVGATLVWRTVIALPLSASGAWRGQFYLADPAGRPSGTLRLRLLAEFVKHAVPGLLNLYLLRRLRSRAETLERARISRELHDTVHQSLAGIEMRMDVLRRHARAAAPAIAQELADVQLLLRRESMDLREVTERLRSADVDARRLPIVLADLVDRFARTTDIDAQLEWTVDRLDLPPHQCSEIVRIVQEALFNVRRHSGAGRVLVRVEADADRWGLVVEDNGRGLGFTGRLAGEDLELHRKGPRVIRERTLALGGTMAIESSTDGTRLELEFPLMEGP